MKLRGTDRKVKKKSEENQKVLDNIKNNDKNSATVLVRIWLLSYESECAISAKVARLKRIWTRNQDAYENYKKVTKESRKIMQMKKKNG